MSTIGAGDSTSTTESKLELWIQDYDHTIVVNGICGISVDGDTTIISGNSVIPSFKWNSSFTLPGNVKKLVVGIRIAEIEVNVFQNRATGFYHYNFNIN